MNRAVSSRVANPASHCVSTRGLRLPPLVQSFFSAHKEHFRQYPGLWLKGGGARLPFIAWAMWEIHGEYRSVARLRDIDLVWVTSRKDAWWILDDIFPEEDVEIVRSEAEYWRTRDVGVNEVLLRPDQLCFTNKALRDIRRKALNPSRSAVDPQFKDVEWRVGIRSLLFSLEAGLSLPDMAIEAVRTASPFNVLLGLYKAWAVGIENAYFDALAKYGNPAPRYYPTAAHALYGLTNELYFELRSDANRRAYSSAQQQAAEADAEEWDRWS